jgi:hypothetical protein
VSTLVHGFCGHCGRASAEGDHLACAEKLRYEPPRFCTQCDRRMVVQVTPTSWTARCVEHGEISS